MSKKHPKQPLSSLDLQNFPLFCIYAFIDRPFNAMYIQYSNGNAVGKVAETITALKRGIHDSRALQNAYNRGTLQVQVLQEYTHERDDIFLIARCCFLVQNSGYRDMTGKYGKMKYKIKKTVAAPYDGGNQSIIPYVYVSLQATSYNALVLGVFENMIEADKFISEHYPKYPSRPINKIAVCYNWLTRQYIQKYGEKLINFDKTR